MTGGNWAYEYMVVTQEFTATDFDERSQRQLDAAGLQGFYVVQCVSWGKFMTWTLCRKVPVLIDDGGRK